MHVQEAFAPIGTRADEENVADKLHTLIFECFRVSVLLHTGHGRPAQRA